VLAQKTIDVDGPLSNKQQINTYIRWLECLTFTLRNNNKIFLILRTSYTEVVTFYSYKPSPFIIMDEVDAALDGTFIDGVSKILIP
jgi:hypothetical protein